MNTDELFEYRDNEPDQLHLDLDYTTIFNEKLAELAIYRNEAIESRRIYTREKDRYTDALEPLYNETRNKEAKVIALEAEIKALAIDVYNTNNIKDIHDKIKERDYVEFIYARAEALYWCKQHDLFLAVDTKQLESYLRSLKGKGLPEFVFQVTNPTITISMEL